ncbi:B3 domain-containing protein VP1 [Oryza brachyantha]|uniref:B3 domain-containing protein VP1 n=1 Tax=Oryza brachyantha TaxID=4533 RepID=UPI001ADCC79C|nr:B3 domain-containing protein VP1 [Oryza brachyantha]
MDASAGSSAPHSQGNAGRQGGGGGRGKAPAAEIRGAEARDDFLFADDTFPSLPDFPCLSSPTSSSFSSSSSSNSSSAFTTAAGGGGGGGVGGEPCEPASAADGFDELADIDQLLDLASLSSVPWEAEPLFPDDVGMMIEDAISGQPHQVDCTGEAKAMLEAAGAEDAGGDACMGIEAADDLPAFFMEWLTSNREYISADDLRSIRLRRSTIEAAAARLGGGRQGTMQLLKLILTWVQNHHLQKKRPRTAMDDAASDPHGHGNGQLPSPGANPGYEFPSGGGQEMGSAAATSWMPYQAFTPPAAYGGEAMYPGGAGPYPFQQSCSTSSVVVNSQPFSPPAAAAPAADMHASSGGNMAWPQQFAPFPGSSTGSYTMPSVVPQPFTTGFVGQYSGGHAMCSQRLAGVEPSATKEARKKRMARQRRLSCLQQQRSQQINLSQIQISGHPQEPSPRAAHSAPVTPSSGGCRSWPGIWPPAGQVIQNPLSNKPNNNPSTSKQQKPSPEKPKPAVSQPAAAVGAQQESPQRSAASEKRQAATKTDKNLRFLLQKVLKQSDVGSLGRIVLPKKEAEVHLPELKTRDGISIPMEDIGTSQVWNMRYRFWPNNKSRMYLLENTGDFVRSNELQEGDFIVIYSDMKSGKYLIRGVKVRRATQLEQGNNNSSGAVGKHKHGSPEKPGVSNTKAAGAVTGGDDDNDDSVDTAAAGKPDGGCKGGGKSPHGGARRSRQEAAAAASMSQMAVSI